MKKSTSNKTTNMNESLASDSKNRPTQKPAPVNSSTTKSTPKPKTHK